MLPKRTIQIYLEDVPGSTNTQKIKNWFDQFDRQTETRKSTIDAIAPHSFLNSFPLANWLEWMEAAKLRNLRTGMAWGAGSTSNARAKGEYYAQIAQHRECACTLIDIETPSWEGNTAPQAAIDLCVAFRRIAPRSTLICQTWHVPTLHAVPYIQFQWYCDAFSSMDYYNEAAFRQQYGVNRYWILCGWFNQSWGQLQRQQLGPNRTNPATRKTVAVPPRTHTIQSYGWNDIIPSLVDFFVSNDNQPVFLWQQNNADASPSWWIPESVWTGLERAQALANAMEDGPLAVWQYQASTADLTIDGLCGAATARSLGVP